MVGWSGFVCAVLIGVALAGSGLWTIFSRLRMREKATGTVGGIDPLDFVSTTPVVTFVTRLGRPVRFVGGNDIGFSRVRIGRTVPVRYSAHDPSKARIATFYMSFLLPAFFVFMGIGLLVLVELAALD